MTAPLNKPTRPQPRFSVRTLVCAYAACWGPTERQGVADVATATEREWWVGHMYAHAPLLVCIDHDMFAEEGTVPPKRTYYIWCFGYVAKLPYERDLSLQRYRY